MNRMMLMLALIATAMVAGACEKKDFGAVTGTTDYTSVGLTSDSTAYHLKVTFVPRVITVDTTQIPNKADTIPAHYIPTALAPFDPTATLLPQAVAVANGRQNMTFTFSDPKVSEVVFGDTTFLQPDTLGTSTLTVKYTDVNHDFATTTLTVPITVTLAP